MNVSTGLNCVFIEVKATAAAPSGEWFYILEDGSAPKQSWDWREYATAYGPFIDKENTREHLRRNHANPGGYSVSACTRADVDKDPILKKLLADALLENEVTREVLRKKW